MDTALALILAGACLVGLSFLFWRQARPPRCAGCGEGLVAIGDSVINDTPPVVETTYRCPRCRRTFEKRVVASWE